MKRYARKSSGVHMRSVIIGPRRAKVVLLAVPPKPQIRRENYCRASGTHCWRKLAEYNCTQLHGADRYRKQVPLARAIPLWGGCGFGGFAPVIWHRKHKMDADEWVGALQGGALTQAVRSVRSKRQPGLGHVSATTNIS